jgi:hypothetical protein
MAKLTSCQLESYCSVTEWISAHDKIIDHLAVCDITIEDAWKEFYIMSNLLNTEEWRTIASTLNIIEKADTVVSIVTHLLAFEARLCRVRSLGPDAALCVTKIGRGRGWMGNDRNSDNRKGDNWKNLVIFPGCGVNGYIKVKCSSKLKWASYEKSQVMQTWLQPHQPLLPC